MTLLWTPPTDELHASPAPYELHDYQLEDAAALESLWARGYRAPICRHATGLGKSVMIAECCRTLMERGRVLVTVDVTNLADDLVATIERHVGEPVGVLTGDNKEGWQHRRVIVATVQTLYAGKEGSEWFRELDPADFAGLLVDECETSLARRYSEVVKHFKDGNPQIRIAGFTATPFRGDGRGMGELYDYAADEPGPLNRDILWARDNGWLVGIKQAFVRVSIDFSTLSIRKNEDGERDYSEADLVRKFEEEVDFAQLAKGIHAVAQGEPSIVICPQSVEVAKAVAHYLDAECRGSAHAVYAEQGRHADDLIAWFKRGDFPYIVSVNKLYKGFNADRVRYVFMCRKTKSRRLYEQAMGRGTRPLATLREQLHLAAGPEERRALIAASDKPHMVMVDMVGVGEKAKDLLGVIDILGAGVPHEARQRAKERMVERVEEEQDTEQQAREAEHELAEEARRREEAEQRRRRLVQARAHVEVEVTDDLRVGAGRSTQSIRSDVPQNQLAILQKAKVPEADIARMTPEQIKDLSRECVRRWKLKLCSYRQAKLLRRYGYSRQELHDMSYTVAAAAIEAIKANGWKRPQTANVTVEI